MKVTKNKRNDKPKTNLNHQNPIKKCSVVVKNVFPNSKNRHSDNPPAKPRQSSFVKPCKVVIADVMADCEKVVKDTSPSSKPLISDIPSQKHNVSNVVKPCKVVMTDVVKNREKKKCDSSNVVKQCKVVLEDINKGLFHRNLDQLGDGKAKRIFKCNSKRCELNPYFTPRNKAISTCTERIYDCVTPAGTMYLNCHSTNLVYLLTCETCGMQYVGETCQQLNSRFNGHRAGMKNPKKQTSCKILSHHFNFGVCKDSKYKVQILEKLEGNGRTERGAIDSKITSLRKSRELYWMLQLRTVYPYGLNDRVGNEFKRDTSGSLIGLNFPSLKRPYPRRCRGTRRKGEMKLDHKTFLSHFKHKLKTDLKGCLNFIRRSISSMRKSEIRNLADLIHDELPTLPNDFPFIQWYTAILDIIDCRSFKKPASKPKKHFMSNKVNIEFKNKGVEMININSILRCSEVKETIPSVIKKFSPPTVVYSLTQPISSKVFNFTNFVKTLDVDNFLQDNTSLPCSCARSPFRDKHHGHVISGDLRIVTNNKLRKLLSKGPKFRESKNVDLDVAQTAVLEGISKFRDDWSERHKFSKEILTPWYVTIKEKVCERVKIVRENLKTKFTSEVLKTDECMKALKQLQDTYVITPIDKAANNIAFICKRFYATILVKELGLHSSAGNETYVSLKEANKEKIVKEHVDTLSKEFNLTVPEQSKTLPHIYWLPKLHKTPIKFRFIIAAPDCSIKPLTQTVTKLFKLFYKQIERYNEKTYYYSSINSFWVIDNNKKVLKSIAKLNTRRSVKTINTFDFSTLYTKIPHSKLLFVLNELIDFCFKGGNHHLLSVNKSNARWVTGRANSLLFDIDQTKEALRYVMNNCQFSLGPKLFRQVVGIPMGSDPAPFFANLFLYYYENKWVKSLKRIDILRARKFSHTFRFIDDLFTINDGNEFCNHFKEIYPPELQLNPEHSGEEVNFLDIHISKDNGKLDYKLYDKRNSFPFSIVRLPFVSSNIPSSMFYASVGAEVLRIGRVSSSLQNFKQATKPVIERVKKQGARLEKLNKTLKKIYGRQDVLKLFGRCAKDFCSNIL